MLVINQSKFLMNVFARGFIKICEIQFRSYQSLPYISICANECWERLIDYRRSLLLITRSENWRHPFRVAYFLRISDFFNFCVLQLSLPKLWCVILRQNFDLRFFFESWIKDISDLALLPTSIVIHFTFKKIIPIENMNNLIFLFRIILKVS